MVIRGMEDQPHFKRQSKEAGDLDFDLIEAETVACGLDLVKRYPEMGAIVFECSMLPPYAKAVQDVTGCPYSTSLQ